MGGFRDPLHFPNDGVLDGGAAAAHPFSGLRSELIGQVGDDGISGVPYYFNDFVQWEGPVAEGAASGWLLSGVTGVATIALGTTNGEIVLTADATANADPTLQLGAIATGTPFLYRVGKRMWCFARLKIGTIASTEFFFGLGTPDTEPTVTNTHPSDGLFFAKAAAATKLDFVARKDGTSTTKSAVSNTLVDATYVVIGFMVDLSGNVFAYQDGRVLPLGNVAAGTANLPVGAADVLQFMLGFRGASQTVTLDWLLLAQDR